MTGPQLKCLAPTRVLLLFMLAFQFQVLPMPLLPLSFSALRHGQLNTRCLAAIGLALG